MNNQFKKAFTLAEVLITLVVIGIIASLTVPAVIQNTQKAELVASLKITMADLSNAANMVKMENAGSLVGLFNDHNDIMNVFCNHMSCTRKCYANQDIGLCMADSSTKWKNLQGNNGWYNFNDRARFVLANGVQVVAYFVTSACTNNSYNYKGQAAVCSTFYVDINGFKLPNTLGRDIFAFYLTKNGIVPFGLTGGHVSDWNLYCNTTSGVVSSGNGCTAKVVQEDGIYY